MTPLVFFGIAWLANEYPHPNLASMLPVAVAMGSAVVWDISFFSRK